MGQYAGNPATWIENVYQFEQTDVVEGGPTGIDNVPLKNLADRTAWLKDNMGGIGAFSDVTVVDDNVALTMNDHFGKLIAVNAAGKTIAITLNAANTYRKGTLFAIMAFNVDTSQVTVQTTGGQILIDDSAVRTKMYLGDGDKLWVVVGENTFYISDKKGNFDTVGEPFYSHINKPNSYRLLGQTFTSINDPRLAEYAESLGSNLLADSTRLYVNLLGQMPYQGAFSKIDATTYRLPDLRGVALRGLDLGSGRDLSRLWEQPGGYEHDALKRHGHFSMINESLDSGNFPYEIGRDVTTTKAPIKIYSKGSGGGRESYVAAGQSGTFPFQQPNIGPTSEAGTATETIMKNIGLIPLIRR